MSTVTLVTYHYVRPLDRTNFPSIKGRHTDEFVQQVQFLRDHYEVVSLDDVAAALGHGEALPPRAAVLTFDDGLSDHFRYVTPILVDHGLSGAFFPPSAAVMEREMLDVHRLHFVLASGAPTDELIDLIREAIRHDEDCDPFDRYWTAYAQASRYDPEDVVFVKKMIQTALPEETRQTLCSTMFAAFVSPNEEVFAEELYVTPEQLRMMRRSGMTIGSHGHSHQRLSSLSVDDQRTDLQRSLGLLDAVGVPVATGWTLCFPYGDYSTATCEIAHDLGCSLAVTVEQRVADLTIDHALQLPRIDTNELQREEALYA